MGRFLSVLVLVAVVAGIEEASICRDEGICLSINVCLETNGRGEQLLKEQWYHRKDPSMWIDAIDTAYNDGTQTPTSAYNFYNIHSVSLSPGLMLQVCEPNFEKIRDNQYNCYYNTITNITCSGPSSCTTVIPSSSRTQMMRYSFEAGYGCFMVSELTPGTYLTQLEAPNRIESCKAVAEATFDSCVPDALDCCAFTCDNPDNYVKNTDTASCDPKCGNVTQLTCGRGEYATTICEDMHPVRFSCAACSDTHPGFKFVAWDEGTPSECQLEACQQGTYSTEASEGCFGCAKNTYAAATNSSACTPCEFGSHTAGEFGQAACVECFTAPVDSIVSLCAPGEVATYNRDEIVEYSNSLVTNAGLDESKVRNMLLADCERGWSCMPCPPGSYEVNNECVLCAQGFYQPNYQETACFACGGGLTTVAPGAVDVEACVCKSGFE